MPHFRYTKQGRSIKSIALPAIICLLISACGGGGGSDAVSVDPNENTGSTLTDTGNPSASGEWLIPADEVVDGGPGVEGIPSLDNPLFVHAGSISMAANELLIGFRDGDEVKALPHRIMNWHEIVNYTLMGEPVTLSYCPLTGSAMSWQESLSREDPTYGVSGLLYNSNLILRDRETGSHWSQMLELAVRGERQSETVEGLQLIETTWQTWQSMYPDSLVLSDVTGFSRNYNVYPYGSFRVSDELLFPVSHADSRLHKKARVIGIRAGDDTRVYPIDSFARGIQIINDEFNGVPIVVVGSSDRNFAAIFGRTLSDGTLLEFSSTSRLLPVVMQDNEGNQWDIFGVAVEGQRQTEILAKTNSYTAFWFAWSAFFPGAEIH